jgi:hypothetical protein
MTLSERIGALANGQDAVRAFNWENASDDVVLAAFAHFRTAAPFEELMQALRVTYEFSVPVANCIAGALINHRQSTAKASTTTTSVKSQNQKKSKSTKKKSDSDSDEEDDEDDEAPLKFVEPFFVAQPRFAAKLAQQTDVREWLGLYMRAIDPQARAQHATFLQLSLFAGRSPLISPGNFFKSNMLAAIATGLRSKELHDLATGVTRTVGSGITFDSIYTMFRARLQNWVDVRSGDRGDLVCAARSLDYFKTCSDIIAHLVEKNCLNVEQLHLADADTQRILVQMSMTMMRAAVARAHEEHPKALWWGDKSTLTSAESQRFGWLSAVPEMPPLVDIAALAAATSMQLMLPPPTELLRYENETICGVEERPLTTIGALFWLAIFFGWTSMVERWGLGDTQEKDLWRCLLGIVDNDLMAAVTAYDGDDAPAASSFAVNRSRLSRNYVLQAKKQLQARCGVAPGVKRSAPGATSSSTPSSIVSAAVSSSSAQQSDAPADHSAKRKRSPDTTASTVSTASTATSADAPTETELVATAVAASLESDAAEQAIRRRCIEDANALLKLVGGVPCVCRGRHDANE